MKEGFRYSTASSARSSRSEEEMKDGLSLRYSTVSSGSSSSSRRIGKRCLLIAKQQRTRFYILRRCITMLLCWHAHAVRDWYILSPSIYLWYVLCMPTETNQPYISEGEEKKKSRGKSSALIGLDLRLPSSWVVSHGYGYLSSWSLCFVKERWICEMGIWWSYQVILFLFFGDGVTWCG